MTTIRVSVLLPWALQRAPSGWRTSKQWVTLLGEFRSDRLNGVPFRCRWSKTGPDQRGGVSSL